MSERLFQAEEVAKHTSKKSCWLTLYGNVYDVTTFLPQHPGGSKVILQLSGRDATDEFDPIHPPGTLEESLKPLGRLAVQIPVAPISKKAVQRPIAPMSNGARAATMEEQSEVAMRHLLNLDEIEALATKKMSKKAWAYYFSAGDDLITKGLNNSVYRSILLRPRIFVDCERCDTSTTLLGHRVGTPIFVAPTAMARLGHAAGEKGIADGVSSFGALQIISNYASMTPEQIVAKSTPGQIFGWQLYINRDRSKSVREIAKMNSMGDKIKFICLTLDSPVLGKREHDERLGNSVQARENAAANAAGRSRIPVHAPSGSGPVADLTWKITLKWLSKHTEMPIVLKGVQTYEDAYLAMQCVPQVKAIIISNHGGRSLDTASPAAHTLLEIRKYCPEVFERVEVWVDGGIKRGTDVVKAMCLGAKAVGVGRAALYGLGAGGVEGVERTFQILQDEIETCMRFLGAETLNELGPQFINSRAVERDIFNEGSTTGKLDQWIKCNL